MMRTRIGAGVSLWLVVALPALAKTYKNTYPVTCGDVWPAV